MVFPRKHNYQLVIFTAALVLRLIPVLLTRSIGIGLDDMFQYDMLARSLAGGNGYRWYSASDLERLKPYVNFDLSEDNYDPGRGIETSFRAPLYPFFLSVIYRLVSSDENRFFAARLAQVLLGAVLVPLTYGIARRLFPAYERVAPISAWFIAGYPLLVVYPLGLGTENLFFPLLLASFLVLLNTKSNPSTVGFILAGVFLGLTALTRSVVLPFAAFSIIWVGCVNKQWKGAQITLVVLMLIISPWIIRNSILHKRLTGIETSIGYNLYLGYHPKGNGSFVFGPSLDLLAIMDDAEREAVGTLKAKEFIYSQPERIIPLAANRLGYFWGLEKRAPLYLYANNIVGNIPLPVLLLLLFVLLVPFPMITLTAALSIPLLSNRPGLKLVGILTAAYLLPHIFILSEDRFHLALVPFIAILSGVFWNNGFKSIKLKWRQNLTGKVLVIIAVLTIFYFIFNWGSELSRDADKILRVLGPGGNTTYPAY